MWWQGRSFFASVFPLLATRRGIRTNSDEKAIKKSLAAPVHSPEGLQLLAKRDISFTVNSSTVNPDSTYRHMSRRYNINIYFFGLTHDAFVSTQGRPNNENADLSFSCQATIAHPEADRRKRLSQSNKKSLSTTTQEQLRASDIVPAASTWIPFVRTLCWYCTHH